MDLALNGSGIHDTTRVLGISPQTVIGELKKIGAVNLRLPTRPDFVSDPAQPLLCMEEMWSFVRHKKEQR